MVIRVRALAETDKARWQALFQGYIEFYRAQVAPEVIESTWQRLSSNSDGLTALVAVNRDGVAIGLAHLLFHRSTWSPTWYCYLEDLFVDPAARGRGTGLALIAATYAEADRRGATRTYWATQAGNAKARRLYNKTGVLTDFVQYRREWNPPAPLPVA